MIKLSRLTDYGVVLMTQMAKDMSAIRTAPELAMATGIPTPTVAKLLKLLVKGGAELTAGMPWPGILMKLPLLTSLRP